MLLHRRSLLALVGTTTVAAPVLAHAQAAAAPSSAAAATPAPLDQLMGVRAIGNPKAPVSVIEYFSMTCTHCAAFAKETFPVVQKNLIDTGKVYYMFRDFPLDQVALMAQMVARALPTERYVPFLLDLFGSQDSWAFAQGVDSKAKLAQAAAFAGMPRATFDATVNDTDFRNAILQQQDQAQKTFGVNSTPTFIVNGPKEKNSVHPGEMPYADFAAMIQAAAG
jgi:protein-disulfide isomerase